MADNTTTGLSSTLLKAYWIPGFLKELRSNLVFKQLGEMGELPDGEGEIVHWLSMADLSVHTNQASQGSDPTPFSLSGGDKTARLQPYDDAIKMSRQLAKTWIKGSMDQVLNKLSRHAARKTDRIIRDAILTGGGIAQFAGSAVARNSIPQDGAFTLDVAEIREGRNKMERVDVAPHTDGFYIAVAHPDSMYDVEGDTNWRDVVKYDSRTFRNIMIGEVGEIHKVRHIKSTEAFNSAMGSGGTAATVYQTYMFGREAFGISEFEDVDIVVKNPAPASSVNGYATAGYYFSFANRALEPSAYVRIESVASING